MLVSPLTTLDAALLEARLVAMSVGASSSAPNFSCSSSFCCSGNVVGGVAFLSCSADVTVVVDESSDEVTRVGSLLLLGDAAAAESRVFFFFFLPLDVFVFLLAAAAAAVVLAAGAGVPGVVVVDAMAEHAVLGDELEIFLLFTEELAPESREAELGVRLCLCC